MTSLSNQIPETTYLILYPFFFTDLNKSFGFSDSLCVDISYQLVLQLLVVKYRILYPIIFSLCSVLVRQLRSVPIKHFCGIDVQIFTIDKYSRLKMCVCMGDENMPFLFLLTSTSLHIILLCDAVSWIVFEHLDIRKIYKI